MTFSYNANFDAVTPPSGMNSSINSSINNNNNTQFRFINPVGSGFNSYTSTPTTNMTSNTQQAMVNTSNIFTTNTLSLHQQYSNMIPHYYHRFNFSSSFGGLLQLPFSNNTLSISDMPVTHLPPTPPNSPSNIFQNNAANKAYNTGTSFLIGPSPSINTSGSFAQTSTPQMNTITIPPSPHNLAKTIDFHQTSHEQKLFTYNNQSQPSQMNMSSQLSQNNNLKKKVGVLHQKENDSKFAEQEKRLKDKILNFAIQNNTIIQAEAVNSPRYTSRNDIYLLELSLGGREHKEKFLRENNLSPSDYFPSNRYNDVITLTRASIRNVFECHSPNPQEYMKYFHRQHPIGIQVGGQNNRFSKSIKNTQSSSTPPPSKELTPSQFNFKTQENIVNNSPFQINDNQTPIPQLSGKGAGNQLNGSLQKQPLKNSLSTFVEKYQTSVVAKAVLDPQDIMNRKKQLIKLIFKNEWCKNRYVADNRLGYEDYFPVVLDEDGHVVKEDCMVILGRQGLRKILFTNHASANSFMKDFSVQYLQGLMVKPLSQ